METSLLKKEEEFRAEIEGLELQTKKILRKVKDAMCEEVKRLQLENQALLQDKEKWFLQYNSTQHSQNKQEKYIQSINDKLILKESHETALKKEIEELKGEVKNLAANTQMLQARLNRAVDNNDKLKLSLLESKEKEKEIRESVKRQINELNNKLRKSEKQKTEILHGFKKQILLIDNLKKQKNHLEVLKLGELAEAEFMKILDWKLD